MPILSPDTLWGGTYTDADLEEARAAFSRNDIKGGELSSILYTAAGKKRAEGGFREYTALLTEAVAVSDAHAIVTGEHMSVEELDVWQKILQEAGRLDEAEETLVFAISKVDDETPLHLRALLALGRADLALKRGEQEEAKEAIEEIETYLEDPSLDRRQAIRLYRGLVRFYRQTGDVSKTDRAREEAEKLIAETGALDQKPKLERDLSA